MRMTVCLKRTARTVLPGRAGAVLAAAALAAVTLFVPLQMGFPQEEQDLQWYDSESKDAIEAENYETAVKILKEGIERFPFAVILNLRLADLYYGKELYNLALKSYLTADGKVPDDFYTLSRIQRCHGYLNQNQDAVRVLERIVSLFPDSEDSAVDLGWMYFKTHQLEKGERVLLRAMQSFGVTRSLSMTLGTVYSDMYRYNDSKEYYLRSIQDALEEGDASFAAVAYYNLSLLERGFYQYNSALRHTEESIGQQDRATGHLSKGELLQSRLYFRGAVAEYQRGLAMDDSPLTKVNLAILYQKFGLLKYARRYAEEVFRLKDVSWMHYFGTDRDLHMKELYDLLADIYSGLSHTFRLSPARSLWERLKLFALSVSHRVKSNWYRRKFRELTLKVGKDYLAKGNYLDAYWEFYKANEPYRDVALKYLHRARDIETQVKPHAEAYYLQEEGMLKRSRSLLEASIERFDPFWEKEAICDSLIEIVRLTDRRTAAARIVLNRLYELNPGALRQQGYGLPLRVSLRLESDQMRAGRILTDMLRHTGSEIVLSPLESAGRRPKGDYEEGEGFRYELQIDLRGALKREGSTKGGTGPEFQFIDTYTGDRIFEGNLEVRGRGATQICYGFAQQLLEMIYSVK
jgi:tetratricopeptide (TPR) repeat protein